MEAAVPWGMVAAAAAATAMPVAAAAWGEPHRGHAQQQPWQQPPLLVMDHTLSAEMPWQHHHQHQQQQQLLSPDYPGHAANLYHHQQQQLGSSEAVDALPAAMCDNSDDTDSPKYDLELLLQHRDQQQQPDAPPSAAAATARGGRAAGSSRQQLGRGGSLGRSGAPPPAAAAHGKGLRVRSKATTPAQREAHKRYRERKKQSITAMEQEVAEMQQQLQALEAEHAQLKSRERVLETAKRCSTEICELMQLLDGLPSLVIDDDGVADSTPSHTTDVEAASDQLKRAASVKGNGYLQRLLQDPAAAGGAGGAAAAAGAQPGAGGGSGAASSGLQASGGAEGGQGGGQKQQQPLSMQLEAHWLQLAEQYVCAAGADGSAAAIAAAADIGEEEGTDDGAAAAAPTAPAAPASGQSQAGSATAPAATAAAAAAAASSAASGSVADGGSLGSSASTSISRLLTEVGSVDTPEQGLVVYKVFLRHAEQMLAQARQERDGGDEVGAAATEAKVGQLMRTTIARLQPFLVAAGQGVVYAWGARNLETQEPQEPPASLWPAVLDALSLPAETELDVLACYELFGAPLTRLLDQRAELVAAYRALQDAHALQDRSSAATASTLEAFSEARYEHEHILKAIAANLERYQSLDGVFAHSLTSLLSGAQVAAACVASYPFLPRWHSIVSTLKQRRAAEQAAAQLEEQQRRQRRSTRQRVPSRFATSVLYV